MKIFAYATGLGLLVACGSERDPSGATTTAGKDAGVGDTGASDSSTTAPACTVGAPNGPLEVATDRGLIKGQAAGTTVSFLGIPFASPPVGALRFAPPASPACWTGVKEAKKFAPMCAQRGVSGLSGSEDCLYLNVWTPALGSTDKAPVLFFIHGGANIAGGADANGLYDGQNLAERNRAIVVTMQYRLGPFGFLAHPALSAERTEKVSGNYAILDMISSLQWVQTNIEKFGGDKSRVMIYGESAGALNTCMLLASPLAKGLFSRALMESGGCDAPTLASRSTAGVKLADALGCKGTDAAAAKCLHEKPASDIAMQSQAPTDLFIASPIQSQKFDVLHTWDLAFGAAVDGYVLPEAPITAIRAGRHNHVPFTIGTNAHETELFQTMGSVNTCIDFNVLIQNMFDAPLSAQIMAEYNCLSYPVARWAAVDVSTDLIFACPARRIARAVAQAQAEPVRRYLYTHAFAYGTLAAYRSFHASELPFVFDSHAAFSYAPLPAESALSALMGGYWGEFARKGDPNGGSAADWPAYNATKDNAMVLETTTSLVDGYHHDHCDFWDSKAQ